MFNDFQPLIFFCENLFLRSLKVSQFAFGSPDKIPYLRFLIRFSIQLFCSTLIPVFQHCGVSYAEKSRVIGGTTPLKGRFPWQAAIYRKNRFGCGASLISPTLIITAAHCFNDKNPDNYYVILGEHDRYKLPDFFICFTKIRGVLCKYLSKT